MPTSSTPPRSTSASMPPTIQASRVVDDLRHLADRTQRGRHVHGLLLAVESDDGSLRVDVSAGAADVGDRYLIASISKLFTAAIVGQLLDEGALGLDDRVVDLLPDLDLAGLHRKDGVDSTHRLRLRHLLDQTSGIPDYFAAGGIQDDLAKGIDRSYDLADVVGLARDAEAEFTPGARDGRQASYSDTNYLLLTGIIEAATGRSYAAAVQRRISAPLGLVATDVFSGDDTGELLPIHHGEREVSFPGALASELGAGGIVSTLDEQLRFSRAFHSGELFEIGRPVFNRVFFNVDYGGGMMRFQLPRWMTLGASSPELIGHSGWTGSFLFHSAELGVHIAGTFNQIDSPARPFRLMPRVTRLLQKAQSRP